MSFNATTGMLQIGAGTGNISSTTGFTTGSTGVIDTGAVLTHFAVMIVAVGGTLTGTNTMYIEGSLDNTNWYHMASDTGTVSATYTAAGIMRAFTNSATPKAYRYLRVSYGTLAGETVTVTGTITGGSLTIQRAGAL